MITTPFLRRGCLAAALLGTALSGCTVGPDYVGPELPRLAASRSFLDTGRPAKSPLPVLQNTTPAPPDAEWWRAFRDPILTELVSRVAAQNLDVRTATFRLAESRAQLGTAAAAALPQVNGTASAYRQQYSANGVISKLAGGVDSFSPGAGAQVQNTATTPFESYTAGFDASWELDLWGRIRRNVESAEAQAEASADARRATLVSNQAELARDYIQLRGTQDLIRIDLANIKINQEILDVVRTRQQRGLVTGLDTASASSQVEAIQAQLPQLQQQEVQQINAIGFLLGLPPLALSDQLIKAKGVPPIPPKVPVGVPSDLLQRRPDVRQADAQLHAAVAQIGVAKAQFFPTVSITGSPTFNAVQPDNVFKGSSLQYMNVGPSITIPIFEGGRLKSNLVLQEARQKEAAVAYQKTVLQAWHDVVNALVSLKADEARRARLTRQVADARQALSLARSRYQQGVDTFTTILQNSQTVLQAEMNLSQATAGISTDFVALYKALGGGWETSYPAQPASRPAVTAGLAQPLLDAAVPDVAIPADPAQP